MVSVGDPVGVGLIASLARPGGNVTGVSTAHEDFAAKWLQLLHEAVPKASRIGYLEDLSPNSPITQIFLKEILAAGDPRRLRADLLRPTPDESGTLTARAPPAAAAWGSPPCRGPGEEL